MSDDWLQHGHEMDGVELVPVLSSGALDAPADVASTPRWTSGWRGLVVGGSIAVLATLGVVGVANAIGDNLFPSMGSARPSSVWLNPVPPTAPEQTVDVAPTITTATTTTPTTAPTTIPSTSAPTPTAATTTPSTSSSTSRVTVPSTGPSNGVTSPTTSAPDVDDDDEVVVVTTAPDQPDDSGSGSGGSGSSGSGSGGSDDLDDSDD